MLCFRGIGIDFSGAVACMITLTPRLALAVDPAPVGPSFSVAVTGRQASLSDYKDKRVVGSFYPKDQTSGCTLEAP